MLAHLTKNGILVTFNGSKVQTIATLPGLFTNARPDFLRDRLILAKSANEKPSLTGSKQLYDTVENMRLMFKPSGFASDELKQVSAMFKNLALLPVLMAKQRNSNYPIYQRLAEGIKLETINRELRKIEGVELSVVTDDWPFFHNLTPSAYFFLVRSNGF